jgi:hypothetical protein
MAQRDYLVRIDYKISVFKKRIGMSHAKRLPRCRGHFFNWYDTRTLKPLPPLFVSTVDSGNLAGCLVTLKQGCLDIGTRPIFRGELWQGIRDHLDLVTELVGKNEYPNDAGLSLRSLTQRLEMLGEETLVWLRALPELEKEASILEFRLYVGWSAMKNCAGGCRRC